MKVENAIKKLSKYTELTPILDKEGIAHRWAGKIGSTKIEFCRNGSSDEITCISTCPSHLERDIMTDYFPESYHRNLKQAIDHALWVQKDDMKRTILP